MHCASDVHHHLERWAYPVHTPSSDMLSSQWRAKHYQCLSLGAYTHLPDTWQLEVIINLDDPNAREHSECMHVQHQSSSMQHDVTYIAA